MFKRSRDMVRRMITPYSRYILTWGLRQCWISAKKTYLKPKSCEMSFPHNLLLICQMVWKVYTRQSKKISLPIYFWGGYDNNLPNYSSSIVLSPVKYICWWMVCFIGFNYSYTWGVIIIIVFPAYFMGRGRPQIVNRNYSLTYCFVLFFQESLNSDHVKIQQNLSYIFFMCVTYPVCDFYIYSYRQDVICKQQFFSGVNELKLFHVLCCFCVFLTYRYTQISLIHAALPYFQID